MKIHLDTDFGGDPDDACALAYLLASQRAELVGITTNLDHDGFRAGCVRYYLGADDDWNVQCDTRAASILAGCADLTLVPLSATLKTSLRKCHLPALRKSGPIGELLARQSEIYGEDRRKSELARLNAGLPHDLVNFHHDPLTAAVALQWPGATVKDACLELVTSGDGSLRFQEAPGGRRYRVVVDVDGESFSSHWLSTVTTAP